MTDVRCETARELIPDLVGDRLGAAEASRVAAHLETCADCRAEAELARLLYVARPQVPVGLAGRLAAAVRADRPRGRRPWWGLAAAAVAVLALGIGVASRSTTDTDTVVPGFVAQGTATTGAWVNDNGMVAGAPALDGLSDEALQALLNELESNGTGGSA
jgi:predicted anti-sigma-YlaC factor YlaD